MGMEGKTSGRLACAKDKDAFHGNAAPKPENPGFFTPLGDGFGSNLIPAGL